MKDTIGVGHSSFFQLETVSYDSVHRSTSLRSRFIRVNYSKTTIVQSVVAANLSSGGIFFVPNAQLIQISQPFQWTLQRV